MSASIHAEFITLNVSDGTTMRAYKARPEGAVSQSGLLVFQEAFGVNAHMRDVTERFARKGYLAVAPELFHRTEPGFEGCYDDFPSAMRICRPSKFLSSRRICKPLTTGFAPTPAIFPSRPSAIAWGAEYLFWRRSRCLWRAPCRITAAASLPIR